MNKQRVLWLAVETAAGASLEEAAAALCDLATRLQMCCQTDFNDVLLLVAPGDDPSTLVDAFNAARKNKASVATVVRSTEPKMYSHPT